MTVTGTDIISRWTSMDTDASVFKNHWREVRRFMYPAGDRFFTKETPGRKQHEFVLDNTGEMAADTLASAIVGAMTNSATRWFALRVQDPALEGRAGVGRWLDIATRRMLAVFNSPRSHFNSAQHEKMLEVVNYGTGPMFIAEAPGVGPLFQTHPLANVRLAEGADGQVDTAYRAIEMSARAAVQEFGAEALSSDIVTMAFDDARKDSLQEFIHAVEPRTDRDELSAMARDMPWSSHYVEKKTGKIIREGGFPEFPWVAPRWQKRAREVYGRSPAMAALADVKMLQRTMASQIDAAELAIQPPLQAPHKGVRSKIKLTRGGITYITPEAMKMSGGLKPLITGARPDIAEDFMRGIRERIQTAFLHHLLTMLRDPRATATQILTIAEEVLRQLGPVLGRMESEDLGPMIERVFAIMLRQGMLPPVPIDLDRVPIEIEYVSPMAKQQRVADARGIVQTIEVMAPIIGQQPEILDNVNGDATFRYVADLFGWPKDTLNDNDRVVEIRTARQETATQEIGRQQLLETGEVAAKLIPALAAPANDQAAAA